MNNVINAKIISKIFIQKDVVELIIKPNKIRNFTPGSFVQLTLDIVSASERWPESRTFSIANFSKDFFKFYIKDQGFYTNKILHDTIINQEITIKYPFGEMYNRKNVDDFHVMIAGGLGVTPFLSMIEYFNIEQKKSNYSLFYSVKEKKDFINRDYLINNVKNLHLFTSREITEYTNKRIQLEDVVNSNKTGKNTHYYICGSKEFINYFQNGLLDKGILNIHLDEWQ